ncbi:PAS domain-containing protein [Streptomyces aurantiacus]|uniref:PAS domain-containing protein n=1 Tax=Streptomyces aurantiacus TaxID=47760 RepID=UPI002790BF9F|nr:PAS domain-containing protein [Streptomyces aurantiacus]MDQ0771701.1 PAS domain-containing protein [Streptomyces aurantiacus]
MGKASSDHDAHDRDLDIGREALETLLSASPVSLYVFDDDLRLVRYSLAAGDLLGVPSDALLGRPFAEVAPGFDARAIERELIHIQDTGEAVVERAVRGRPLDDADPDPDHEHAMSYSAFRMNRASAGRWEWWRRPTT